MDSTIIGILEILSAAKKLSSVGFSAGYNFSNEKVEEYLNELLENINNNDPIFSGVIIIEKSEKVGNFIIIDGLQRITTVCLLLCALCAGYKDTSAKNNEARYKIFTRYLINEGEVKLQLDGGWGEIYRRIVFSLEFTEREKKNSLYRTYKSFLDTIKIKKISATKLFDLIKRMKFMVIFTEKTEIPAQEIYQSLNPTKEDLSQINLITSFISEQDEAAENIWGKTVESFTGIGLSNSLKEFIKDFLTIQSNGRVPEKNELYKYFKRYYKKISQYQSAQQITEYIYRYSKFYLKIIQANFDDFEIQKHIVAINENNGQDTYPYLMEVLDDFENQCIKKEMFLEILMMVNGFVTNRRENPTEDKINFASLSREINKTLALQQFQPSEKQVEDRYKEKIKLKDMN
ncbi:MAG TPA: DUF262 domain-containing protein [Candidatus Gastranaerophilaceae bacterium]|nr:DUF262 domain-containing protein [Candidatus Gastranaerophilaceae bacterium]HPT41758.1 DUF262 domain-containing protein [Candidatus Gastranaerophilaceae bacterium]